MEGLRTDSRASDLSHDMLVTGPVSQSRGLLLEAPSLEIPASDQPNGFWQKLPENQAGRPWIPSPAGLWVSTDRSRPDGHMRSHYSGRTSGLRMSWLWTWPVCVASLPPVFSSPLSLWRPHRAAAGPTTLTGTSKRNLPPSPSTWLLRAQQSLEATEDSAP